MAFWSNLGLVRGSIITWKPNNSRGGLYKPRCTTGRGTLYEGWSLVSMGNACVTMGDRDWRLNSTPIARQHVRENRIQWEAAFCEGKTKCSAWGVDQQIPWRPVFFSTQVRAPFSALILPAVFRKRYIIIGNFQEQKNKSIAEQRNVVLFTL
jgi:hypothetical protein